MSHKKMRVAINGFGRIGRNLLRAYFQDLFVYENFIEIVAVNDIADIKTLYHLFKYDSAHGVFKGKVLIHEENSLMIQNQIVQILNKRNINELPWKELGIDLVIESTGLFLTQEQALLHVQQGAKRVIISAPSKGEVDATVVFGVNDHLINDTNVVYSNASCTTNCLAPVAKILEDEYGIISGFMNTVHAYTNDQRLVDAPHSDLRRARAASSLIPTTTGATKAVEKVIPSLSGKLQGQSIRVPVINGSITDFTVRLKQEVTVNEINQLFKNASEESMKGILEYESEAIVSRDIIGNPHSGIIDSLSTQVIPSEPSHMRVCIWYDNEWGYSKRLLDVSMKISRSIN